MIEEGKKAPAFKLGSSEGGDLRSTFIIDGDGVVRKVFPKVKVDGHADQVLEALKALGK